MYIRRLWETQNKRPNFESTIRRRLHDTENLENILNERAKNVGNTSQIMI